MNIFSVASPALKMIFERLGTPEISGLPPVLEVGGGGAVVVSNHVGWADSLWLAYALHPRQLRFVSKHELFGTVLTKWLFEQSGCVPINRATPTPSSIKTAVELARRGEIILVFPSGTRSSADLAFKRGAATIALHARVPIVPVFYSGPSHMHIRHLVGRPRVQVKFGAIIPTADMKMTRDDAMALTDQARTAISQLEMRHTDLKSAA